MISTPLKNMFGLRCEANQSFDVTAAKEYLSESIEAIYKKIFDEFNAILSDPLITLHRLVCRDRANDLDPSGARLENMNFINGNRIKNFNLFEENRRFSTLISLKFDKSRGGDHLVPLKR